MHLNCGRSMPVKCEGIPRGRALPARCFKSTATPAWSVGMKITWPGSTSLQGIRPGESRRSPRRMRVGWEVRVRAGQSEDENRRRSEDKIEGEGKGENVRESEGESRE